MYFIYTLQHINYNIPTRFEKNWTVKYNLQLNLSKAGDYCDLDILAEAL